MDNTGEILDAVLFSAGQCGAVVFVYGNTGKRLAGLSVSPACESIKIVLSINKQFDANKFYRLLSSKITIHQEVEVTPETHCIISEPFVIYISSKNGFDPQNLSHVLEFTNFTRDAIFYNLTKKEIIDTTDKGISDFESGIIRNINSPSLWTAEDVLGFAKVVGSIEKEYTVENIDYISKIKLSDLKEPISVTFNDLVIDILTADWPGNALGFIIDTFEDGKYWIFGKALNVASSIGVLVNEDSLPDKVLSKKKLQLVNVYSEFFLSEKTSESPDESQGRLLTILKVLFDSPDSSADYLIKYVTVLPQSVAESLESGANMYSGKGLVESFAIGGPCDYGRCPDCDPNTCSPRCCCCVTEDIVSQIRMRCHKKVVISCNEDGTSPGPGLDPFDPSCTNCTAACNSAMGIGNQICGNIPSQSWWNWPNDVGACDCECKNEVGGNCLLTCVTCDNLFCNSNFELQGGECNAQISLTPGIDCCGDAIIDWMFVIDSSLNFSASEFQDIKDKTKDFVDGVSALDVEARFGITVYGTQAAPFISIPFTEDVTAFKAHVDSLGQQTSTSQPDITAIDIAAKEGNFRGGQTSFLLIIAGGTTSSGEQDKVDDVLFQLEINQIKVFTSDVASAQRHQIAIKSGGSSFDTSLVYTDLIDILPVTLFPTSCDCLDTAPIFVKKSSVICDSDVGAAVNPDCFDIAIQKCFPGEICDCTLPTALNVCGNIITITPGDANLVCCSEVGDFGCECSEDPIDPPGCCGVTCTPPCGPDGLPAFASLLHAQQATWQHCVNASGGFIIDNTDLTDCLDTITECCVNIPDGEGGFTAKCKTEIYQEVADAWENCLPRVIPPPDWKPPNEDCSQTDECIVGEPTGPVSEDRCDDANKGCTSVRNPSTIVLNNGIGLVAYESLKDTAVITIQQFKTSVKNKLLSSTGLAVADN